MKLLILILINYYSHRLLSFWLQSLANQEVLIVKHYDCKAFLRLAISDISVHNLIDSLVRSTVPLSLIDFNIEYGVTSILSTSSPVSSEASSPQTVPLQHPSSGLLNKTPNSTCLKSVSTQLSPNQPSSSSAMKYVQTELSSPSQVNLCQSPTMHNGSTPTKNLVNSNSNNLPSKSYTDLLPDKIDQAPSLSSDLTFDDDCQSHSTPDNRDSLLTDDTPSEMTNSLPDIKQFVKQGLTSFSESLFSMFDKLLPSDSTPDVITTHHQ